ncbi:glycosyltransferase [Aeromicrobium sp. Marseille-Q0843]|uniref:Glycosyltransferase n=1 Tax=Aeromicrobium phoceense TaxID=2754045 RepID=A0A838XFZ8_9ACTN|nr:glycosyltransferase [Aeromicrobium phoceense]MBA4607586.1 glycosyltransferase [Aeromicrobium phoceense]
MATDGAIVHLAQPTTGGVAEVVLQLVEIAVADGRRVVVGCPADGYLAERAQALGAAWVHLDLQRQPGPSDVTALRRTRDVMKDAGVVFAHSSKTGALARAARPRGTRLVFVPHGWSWLVGGRLASAYRLVERLLARRSDVTVVVGNDELAEGRRVLGPRPELRVIENSVDVDRFRPPAVPRPADGRTVVCVGRLARQKGQDLLLRAMATLDDLDPSVRLVGPGEAEQLDSLRALSRELGIEERVEFVGADDPVRHLQEADVVAVPSRWEGLPLVLLEAMACGAPIVASSTAGVDALGDAGVVVPMRDRDDFIADLAAALRTLLESPGRRTDLGRRARRRAEDRYGRARMADEYRALWS